MALRLENGSKFISFVHVVIDTEPRGIVIGSTVDSLQTGEVTGVRSFARF